MKLKATYVIIGANPFLPNIDDFVKQFRYAEAEVPDDSDWSQMEAFAQELTPEGFRYVRLEKVPQLSTSYYTNQWKRDPDSITNQPTTNEGHQDRMDR